MACEYCFSGFNWTPYNDGSGRCFRTVKTEWVSPKIPVTLTAKSATTFSSDGARLYTTYNSDGTNNGSFINLLNVPLWGSSGSTTQGALNRSAIWTTLSDDLPKGIWLGFSFCINNASNAKTYHVGIGAVDNFKIVLDGIEIVNTLSGVYNNANITSRTWHIYPVTIPGGSHTLEVFGLNSVGAAGFGCEVYNNTSTEIINANTIGDLNVIYSTSSQVSATTFQNQSGEYLLSGITCPKGGVVSNCEQGCIQYIICEPPPVTPSQTPTNTPTPTTTPTPTPSTFARSFYVSGCCDNKLYKLQSGNTYKIGDTLRISPGNFCYDVISEPTVPVNTFINDTVGVTVVTGCDDETCQPCPTTTAVTFVNTCKILTILDFNFECNTTNPSKFEAYDGTLSVIITGGTAPYYVTWTDEDNNVYYGKTINNVTTGKYKLTVVDYWGDFSGETTCEIVGPKNCDFNASFFEYLKPCYGCIDVGFVLWNDFCVSRPYEGPSGTTLNITIGDQNGAPDRGTFFYTEVTNLPKPLTFVNYAQFTPSTSAVTISNGQKAFLTDGSNFNELNCSQISKFLGTFDSNWSGTAVPILTTGTTNIWRYNGGGAPYQTLFMRDAIKYNTGANQWVDLTLCLTANTRQLFHFFLAADDVFRLKIDGQWVIYRQNINYNPVPGTCPPTCPPDISFASDGLIDKRNGIKSISISYNHVLPITLDAGVHVIEFGFADIFNFDVLNCCTTSTMVIFTGITTANLAAISNYNSLSAYTAFSTKQLTGTTQTVFTEPGGDYGYYCPSGSTMVDKCGQFYCRKPKQEVPCGQEIIQPSLTPYPTPTNTPTPTITPTTTPTPTPTPTIASCLCFPPFSASPDGSMCLAINTQSPTILATLSAGTGDANTAYGYLGARIYYPNQQNSTNGFNSQGYVIGNYAATIPASPSTPQFLFWKQRLNTQGIWVNGNPNYVGTLSMCDTIDVPVSKIYYVGCAGDNAIIVTINGTTVISQVQDENETQNFAYWHIYPFFLDSGPNVIEISNRNIGDVGSYAAEIYDNTLAELTAATSSASLNLIFSTGDYRFGGPSYGQQFCSNFDCPDGFAYDVDSGLCIQRDELPCAGPTTDVCADFEFAGGASSGGRTFNFINCAGSPQTVVVPQGDTVQFCVTMPYSAPGATFLNFVDCEQILPVNGRLNWIVRRNLGIVLQINDGANTVVNQTSSSVQSFNGQLVSTTTKTYEIKAFWSQNGSNNILKIRICRAETQLYYFEEVGQNFNITQYVTVNPGEVVTVDVIAGNGLLPPCTA